MRLKGESLSADELAAIARAGRKYGSISPSLVRSIAAEEIGKYGKQADVIKHIRSRLHQIAGAYLAGRPRYDKWLKEMQDAANDPQKVREVCVRVMSFHSSTYERAGFLSEFYDTLFAALPPVRSIADLACGYNPMAIPWMKLTPGCRYLAVDVYSDLAEFLNSSLPLLGVDGSAIAANLLEPCPELEGQFDLALVLKTLPCLEQLRRGCALDLLGTIRARHIAVSYPTRSLGGREKGMEEFYEARLQGILDETGWQARQFSFAQETLYIVEKQRAL